jgi:hypothetical protein
MSGLLNSQLAAEGGGGGAEANSHVVQLTERLNNGGWFDEHIDAVDVTAPQFRLIRASGAGQTISPGRTGSVTVVVRVLDCAPVTRTTGIPVQIRLHRFWGEKTLTAGTFESSSLPWDACHPA